MATEKQLSIAQAAAKLGITDALVRRYCRMERIKAHRVGKRTWSIPEKELERFRSIPRSTGKRSRRRSR